MTQECEAEEYSQTERLKKVPSFPRRRESYKVSKVKMPAYADMTR
jgi:hypothetical protein